MSHSLTFNRLSTFCRRSNHNLLNHRHSNMQSRILAFFPTQISYTMSTKSSNTSVKFVDSHGDYLADAVLLEDRWAMPLYSAQETLPRLPVPSLHETCERFLPTALPLAKTAEETQTLLRAVKEFPKQAQHLQDRLLGRSQTNIGTSWLQEWWNQLAYLQIRDPVVVHVSYFFRCHDDPRLEQLLASSNNNQETNNHSYQACIARSAAVLPAAIQYAQMLKSNQMEPATIGKHDKKTVLCSTQCKYMFHACRIPQKLMDKVRLYFPTREHIVVACRGQFFAIDIDNADVAITQQKWRQVLQECIRRTTPQHSNNNNDSNKTLPPALGWLTAMNRDNWAEARDVLLKQGGPAMEVALESLESSMFMLCMDIDESASTDRERALQFWHGCSESPNKPYVNRWFDKSAAVFVTQNGKLGFQGEHSMLDGMPFVDFCDAMVNQGTVQDDCLDVDHDRDGEALPKITNIFEAVFASMSAEARVEIDQWLEKANKDFITLVSSQELHAQHYRRYGSSTIKKAGCSPDAYMQMAMQLASYRMFGEPLATYESTQVRKFLHGRTETTRTVSPDSLAFCQAMDKSNQALSRSERFEMLQKACSTHVKYVSNAVEGQGVDRHFFGLTMCLRDGEHPPDLFSHELYEKSKRFRLSTSSLPNMAVGFGPVCEDGFGIGYEAQHSSCIFHVTARKEHGWTEQLCEYLGQALDDMRNLYDIGDGDKALRSRL